MSIPSFKAVLLPHHIKEDGSCNVKIRLTHNRKTKYIPTTEYARKGDYTKKLVIKNNNLLRKLTTLISEMEACISELGYFQIQTMSVDQIIDAINIKMKKEEFKLDFFEFAETIIDGKREKCKGSADNYKVALNSFRKFMNKDKMDIQEITSNLMKSYEEYLVKKYGEGARAVSQYTACMAFLHKQARIKYNISELGIFLIKNPFEYYKPPKQRPAKKFAIPKSTIQKLIDIRPSLEGLHRLAANVFLLSFITMGTNVPDLYEAELEGDNIHYFRMKVRERRFDKGEMYIKLDPLCKKIIKEMKDTTGERAFNLHHQYKFYKSIADKGNDRLKEIAKILGVKPFSMKAARHTWPSIAYSIGIDKGVVNDCLCHIDEDMKVTDIYITKDWSVLWDANRKVLEQFKWK